MIAVLNTAFRFLTNACLESKNVFKWRKGHFFHFKTDFRMNLRLKDRVTEGDRR